MKLRIKGNSIRLRLTRTEVADLGETGFVESSLMIGPNEFVYGIISDDRAEGPTAVFVSNKLIVTVPRDQAQLWVNSNAVSIVNSESSLPNILIEKDFACLDVRQGDDDDDTFPNPKATAGAVS